MFSFHIIFNIKLSPINLILNATSVDTIIGFVFTHIVPQLNPTIQTKTLIVSFLHPKLICDPCSINEGIEAPPKFPNSPNCKALLFGQLQFLRD